MATKPTPGVNVWSVSHPGGRFSGQLTAHSTVMVKVRRVEGKVCSIRSDMNLKWTIRINCVLWVLMLLSSLYVVYSKHTLVEMSSVQNGRLFSQILITEAALLFAIYAIAERLFFRRSRVRRLAQKSPKNIIVAFYLTTIMGSAFEETCVIWGEETLKTTGNYSFLFVLYGIGLLFMAYAFPWKWRIGTE